MTGRNKILKSHVGYWINKLRQSIHTEFEQRLKKYDISVASWCILISVYDKSANSISGLEKHIEVDKASISRQVEKLIQNDLLIRSASHDKRSGIITLSPKGKKLIPLLIDSATENERQFFNILTRREIKTLRNTIHKILSVTTFNSNELLNKTVYMEKTMINIQKILSESKVLKWPYPKLFEALKRAGVQSYTVAFAHGDGYNATYRGNFGSFKENAPSAYIALAATKAFDSARVIEALQKHISGHTDYVGFLTHMAQSGVTHYKVDMRKRTVAYFDNDEENYHEEHVPAPSS